MRECGSHSLAPTPFPKLQSRAALKGSGVRRQAGLSEGKVIVLEGPSGQAARQTAAGSVRASFRTSMWEGFRAKFLTLELFTHSSLSHIKDCQLPLGNMARLSHFSPPL